jgi:hypothetical protein
VLSPFSAGSNDNPPETASKNVLDRALYASPRGQNMIHQMARIVRTAYRYKRPPRKKAPATLAVEPVVTIREPKQKPGNDDPRPTRIVSTISRKEERFRRIAQAAEEAPEQTTDEAATARYRTLIAGRLRKRL